jgi:raffinose/stachyose/melibiose transport system permease protein
MGQRYTKRTFMREAVLWVLAVIWWIPFYILVVGALKPTSELASSPFSLPKQPTVSTFSQAWKGTSNGTLGGALKSSLIITFFSVLLLVAIGSVTSYAVARRPGKLGVVLYGIFVLGIILPFQLGVVPAYVALRHLHLVGTYLGLILLYTGLLLPLSIFLYVGFVRALPREYEEAAQVDGAGLFRTFRRVVFPLLRPITGTVAILTGLIVWNDFFLSLIFLSGTRRQTLPVAIYSFVGEYATLWNLVFAAVIISLAPILIFFLFAQRQLIRGFTGGIKA